METTPTICSYLQSPEEFLKILQAQTGDIFSEENHSLAIKWRICCGGFEKDVVDFVELREDILGEKEALELEVKVLEIRIQRYEDMAKGVLIEDKQVDIIKTQLKLQDNLDGNNEIPNRSRSKPKPKPTKNSKRSKKAPKNKSITKSSKKSRKQKQTLVEYQPINCFHSHDNQEPDPQFQKDEQEIIELLVPKHMAQIQDKVKIYLPNQGVYYGEIKDGFYHGHGYLYDKDFGKYQGGFKYGRMDDYGKLIDCYGNCYEGYFKDDRRNGLGKEIYANGESYIGDYVNDQKQGYGTYHYNDGDSYEGQWMDSLYHGKGREIFADGSYYTGTWFKDERHGEGFYFKDNQIFKQLWRNGTLVMESLEK